MGSEGHALGGVFLVARAAQLGPPEPVGSQAWLRNPARRARGSRFAQLQDWSSDAGPHLGRGCRSQLPRPCTVRPGLVLGPGPGRLQGPATPTLASPGADRNARAPAARHGSCPQSLPRAYPAPFHSTPDPRCTELTSPRGPTPPRPGRPHTFSEAGAPKTRPPLAGTLLRQELRPDPFPPPPRPDPGPARPSPARSPPGPPGAPLTLCPPPARSLLRRREPAPAGLSRLPGRGAAHAPAVPPPPPQQLSQLRGLRGRGDSGLRGRRRESARS